jgi:hypothetical protein
MEVVERRKKLQPTITAATRHLRRDLRRARSSLPRGLASGASRAGRPLRIGLVILATLVVAIALIDVLVDEPVRRSIEARMNRALVGYTVTIAAADLSPWNFSLDLNGLRVVQQAHPDPPVLDLGRLGFSVAWRDLLRARLVADLEIQQPRVHAHLEQLRAELRDETRLEERGWQQALREAYPLRVNRLLLEDGSLTYIDDDPGRPLVLTRLAGEARDIRNVGSAPDEYPSPFHLDAVVFETGRAALRGHADFLAEPLPTVRATFAVADVSLAALQPLSTRVNLQVSGGHVTSRGEVELAADAKQVHVEDLVVAGVRVDYVSDPELTRRAFDAVTAAKREPELAITIDSIQLTDAELGFVDRSREPDYRVFVSRLAAVVSEWTNQHNEAPSRFRAQGTFMGSGDTRIAGIFRPDRDGADFDLAVAIQDTRLESMNDLLRAWANIDVTDGLFSFYSELRVVDGQLDGYVKPLFSDLDVFDPAQDRDKGFFRKLWERLVEGLGKLLENRPREEVATIADLRGSVEDPNASNLQVVFNLIRNAFIESILPGFRNHAEDSGKRRRRSEQAP